MAGNKFENLISEIAPGKYQRLAPHGTYLCEYIVNFKAETTDIQKKQSLSALLSKVFATNFKDNRKTIRIEYEWFINGNTKLKYTLRTYRVSVPKPPKPPVISKSTKPKSRAPAAAESDTDMLMAASDPASPSELAAALAQQPDPSGPILSPPNVSVSAVQTNSLIPVTDSLEDETPDDDE